MKRITKRDAAFALAGLLAGGSVAVLPGGDRGVVDVPPPMEQPFGSWEMTDPAGVRFATQLLAQAKPSGLVCSKVQGGPHATLCTDGAVQLWISDEGAKAIGVPFGTIAISAGAGGKVYVR